MIRLWFNCLDRSRHDVFLDFSAWRPGPDEFPAFILRLYANIMETGFPEHFLNVADERRACHASGVKSKIVFLRLTGSLYLNREDSPLHDDKRLLAIPPSCSQVSDYNSNLDYF